MMKMKKNLFAVLFLAIALALTACTSSTSKNPDATPTVAPTLTPAVTSTTAPTEAPVNVLPTKDRAGNDITIPDTIDKIVSLAPSTTQVLTELGLQEKLVAVDTQSPLYANGLDSLPQYDMLSLDTESIIALDPDIIIATGMSIIGSDDPFQPLRDAGICVAVIPTSNSIQDVEDDVLFIADCFSKTQEGNAIVADMQKDIDEIATIGKTISDKKTVMFEISAAPSIYSFGSGVFLDEMLTLIGAENVFASENSWIPVTDEAAVAANPDVILTSVNYIENPVDEILNRSGWENVTAVKDKQVYYIDNASSSLPNQNIVKALKQMAKDIYPEQYAGITDPFAE